MSRRFQVLKAGSPVLDVVDEPGPLLSLSAGPPPPGWEPPSHEFLTATALDAMTEHELRQLLLASSSTDDYLARLEGAGYQVRPA